MKKICMKVLPAGLLAAALLSGCGGDSSSSPEAIAPPPPSGPSVLTPAPNLSGSVAALYAYMFALIAGTSETGDPVDINGTALAIDDFESGPSVN